jgi:DNA polymerase-1
MLAREEVEELMRLEMRVLRDLIHMELRGHRVDVDLLTQDLPTLIKGELDAACRINELIGASLNYESSQDVAEMVVTKLGLPILSHKPGKNKKTGEDTMTPVFDGAVLQTYGRTYPQHAELFFLIRQARRYADMKAFAQSYLELQVNGAIHTTIKQVEARTGRESSESPNLQNITKEETWDDPRGGTWTAPGCGKYFIAREGHTILSFDYSQIEYRLFAHYLKDERLLKAYRENPSLDMHKWTAEEILENMIERDDAKSANFGIIFNMGKDKLVKFMATNGVGITEQQAAHALDLYHKRVPMKGLQQDVGRALIARGYVKTILGRRRRVTKNPRKWGQPRDKKGDRGLEPYQALNAICQGGAVDLLKHRSTVAREIAKSYGGELILKIHDDIKIEVPSEHALAAAQAIKPVLERFEKPDGTPYLSLPIYVKATATQSSWYDAQKLDLAA